MNDIQKARDVLAKWRGGSTPGPWKVRAESPTMGGSEWTVRTDGVPGIRMGVHEYQHGSTNLDLIVGTAGNPELLDAIELILVETLQDDEQLVSGLMLAAALIAADERMNQ